MVEAAKFFLGLAFDRGDTLDAGDVIDGVVPERTTVVGATFVARCVDL